MKVEDWYYTKKEFDKLRFDQKKKSLELHKKYRAGEDGKSSKFGAKDSCPEAKKMKKASISLLKSGNGDGSGDDSSDVG